jgi:predicted  nucleic acid-binding Zn-ribbon protein
MQRICALLTLALVAGTASADDTSPITKVVQLLSDLETKIIGEGEVAQKEYAEYAEWCEDKSKDLQYEIKTGKLQAEELKATIAKEEATISALAEEIDALSVKIATAESDLKAATEIRDHEAAEFAAEEAELTEVLSALSRAIGILTTEMGKSGAALLQSSLTHAPDVVQALTAMVQASMLSSADAGRLTALVQSSSKGEDSEQGFYDPGAPDAALYEGHSGGIIETLEGLKEKATDQLDTARKTETSNIQTFQTLKQSLEDEIRNSNAEFDQAKADTAAATESKETATGDLGVTTKDLNADIADLAETHSLCMTTAEDFESATRSRAEELKALAAAKKVIKEKTGGADTIEYGLNQVSLLQLSSGSGEPRAVVRYMLDLARKQNSKSLAQLASRISAMSRSGEVPFEKIKGLISDMIDRLESEGEADASHKAYCDKEMHETNVKKDDKTAEIEKMTTAIDQMSSRKAVLEEEVATLMKELSDIAKSQAEYDKWYSEYEATFASNKADMEAGIEGVKIALKILREYYAKADKSHVAAEGAGAGIIGLIEVAESDFTKSLAEFVANMANQKAAYEATTKENEITTTAKNQDVKYKTQEITTLTKELAATTADRTNVQTELDAVMEYLESLHKQCDETVISYAETKARREAEIAGLKDALEILEGAAITAPAAAEAAVAGQKKVDSAAAASWQAAAVALFQKESSSKGAALRGIRRHTVA